MEPLAHNKDLRVYEGASFGVYAAPGCLVFVEGFWGGRKQTMAIDPEEIDELARHLHKAKRYARRASDE